VKGLQISLCCAIVVKLKDAGMVPAAWSLDKAAFNLCGIETGATVNGYTAEDYGRLAAALGEKLRKHGGCAMAKIATAFADTKGKLHGTPQGAVLADLTFLLGRVGAGSNLTAGLAQVIFDKRPEIERAFAEFDTMRAQLEHTHDQ
jgi:hypothetical protein